MTNHYLMKNFSKISFGEIISFKPKALLFVLSFLILSNVQAEVTPTGQSTPTAEPSADAAAPDATAGSGASRPAGTAPGLEVGWIAREGGSAVHFNDFLNDSDGDMGRFTPLRIDSLGSVRPNPCFGINAPEIAGRIRFMGNGLRNPERAVCIPVGNDADARRRGGRYINPANPEYENGVVAEGATQQFNPLGYYLQIPGRNSIGAQINSKREMCSTPDLSRVTLPAGVTTAQLRNFIMPRFQDYPATIPGRGEVPDGVCMCQVRTLSNPEGTPMNCANLRGETLSAMGGVTMATGSSGQMIARPAAASTTEDGFTAFANGAAQTLANLNRLAAGGERSAPAAAAATGQPVTPAAASPTTTVTSAQATVIQCINSELANSSTCRRNSSTARDRCRQVNQENRPMDAIGGVLGAGADMNTMMRAGTGAQGNCMRASMMAMGAREMISSMGEKCDADVGACKESCKEDSYDMFIERCFSNNNISLESLQNRPETDPVLTAYREHNPTIRDNYSVGVNVCYRDLPQAQSDYGNLMTGLGNSLQASMQCACQTSNAAGADCQAVPNINNCSTTPGLPGCDVYGPLGACVPGAVGYDAKTCNCLQNPAATGCASAGGTTPASLFGGNLRAAPAAGGAFVGGGAPAGGTGRASNLDLSSSAESIQANLAGASGTGVTTSGGGSYGSNVSGGGGNGSAPEEAAAAGAPPEAGLSGLFNQAKNAVMNALGKGPNRFNRLGAKSPAAAANMKKFKPLRGIANSEGMGSRNMDIWKMVNMCANGETCASNRNNYMMAP